MAKSISVAKDLEAKAKLYAAKNAEYGDSYKTIGHVLEQIFPNGIELSTPDDQNRYAIFLTMVSKMCRYANNWDKGHADSLDDISVYAMMLKELDNDL